MPQRGRKRRFAERVLGGFRRQAHVWSDAENRSVLVSDVTGVPNLPSYPDQWGASRNSAPEHSGARVEPVASADELDNTGESPSPEALTFRQPRQSYSRAETVFLSSDRREIHFTVAAVGQGNHVQRKYIFLGLAAVDFQDGPKLVGWCSNPACPHSQAGTHVDPIFEGLHVHEHPHQHYGQGDQLLCQEAEKLIADIGGREQLHRLLGAAPAPAESRTLVTQLEPSFNRKPKMAVRDGPSFRDWAVIAQHVSSPDWFCTSCSRVHACGHLATADKGSRVTGYPMLDSTTFDVKLQKDFCIQEGKWKCRSVSRLPLPERIEDDSHLLHIYKERSLGQLSIPAEISLSEEEMNVPCEKCGYNDWQPCPEGEKSLVFLPAEVAETVFESRQCGTQGCTGSLLVDGKEQGLFRKLRNLAFSHEVMYQWAAKMGTGSPDTWSSSWRDHLSKLKGHDDNLPNWWLKLKKSYSEATMDFIRLQNLDYDAGFRCECCKEGITMDGMAMAFKKDKARMEHPWREDPEAGLVAGSLFKDRIFVRSKELRELIRQYAGAGIPLEKHRQMLGLIEQLPQGREEHSLPPFLSTSSTTEGDMHRAPELLRAMLQCLASPAPVCQTLRPKIFPLVESLLQGEALNLHQQRELRMECPILHDLLRPYLPLHLLPDDLMSLLSNMLKLAKAAFQRCETLLARSDTTQAEQARAELTAAARPSRPPQCWSKEETMLRTCSWGAIGPLHWEATDLGGNDVHRRLQRYSADRLGSRQTETCTKHQKSTINLLPGCVFYWCTTCRKCVFFHVMRDAESPRTIFDVLYTRWLTPPKAICFDNGCNLHNYILNREPQHFQDCAFYIDEPHYRGHKACCPAYNTGEYAEYQNSPLAEQKNAVLRGLETQVSYMKQTTFMEYMRYCLYRINQEQHKKHLGTSFYNRPH